MKIGKYLLVGSSLLALSLSPALANEPGSWTMYVGVGSVEPDSKGVSATIPDVDFEEVSVGFNIDSATSMPFGVTYMINENWAIDMLAAWPFNHDINAIVQIPGETESMKIGEFDQAPPTLSVQYHFTTAGNFDPYIGVGFNYTMFSGEKLIPSMVEEGFESIKIDNSSGFAAQLGGHWEFNESWILGFDVRYIEIDADATISGVALDPAGLESVSIALPTLSVDPWVYSVNLGYHF
ncbi:MAG: outer membrane beta-barrel protein [Gammaproteobacteria bacterium]|jgi:outer membrane protein|nr:outer membrane beta-barrel protein [Gammaproteobacteria bacterium]